MAAGKLTAHMRQAVLRLLKIRDGSVVCMYMCVNKWHYRLEILIFKIFCSLNSAQVSVFQVQLYSVNKYGATVRAQCYIKPDRKLKQVSKAAPEIVNF